jgi:murein DD-endopeptidase MepM/ murein hydrolase activator NlpD
MGPAFTADRSEEGIRNRTASSRSRDSRASCASRASVGASSQACRTSTKRRGEVGGGTRERSAVHFIITDASVAKSRVLHLSGVHLGAALTALALAVILCAAGLYHWVFLKGAREGWPVIGSLVKLVTKDEFEQRDRFLRENLDAMARRVGEMQAKLLQIEALGERVSGLAGVNMAEFRTPAGQGGVLVEGRPLTMEDLRATMAELEESTGKQVDLLTVLESRLLDQKIRKMMLPTQQPVSSAHLGSHFGWRIDPFTGRSALHTGLDFQAEPGTAILAAAGGVVVTQELHPAYGNMVEIDHGNNLITRYAHASQVFVKQGDVIKRGQKIAAVGTTGRSTGPHLHFEVLVEGVPQDPYKFLAAGSDVASAAAARTARR